MGKLWLKQSFGMDYRSLALLRIGIGLVLLLDLFIRFPDLRAHYSDQGVLPRAALLQFGNPFHFSLHYMSGLRSVQALLFAVSGAFALALIFGFRTRLVSIVSWFLYVSLCSRNPFVLSGADQLLGLCLFWGILLPWGKYYSLDAFLSGRKRRSADPTAFDFSTAGFVIQVSVMYIFAALLKTGREWHPEGTAIRYVLSLDQFTLGLADISAQFPQLLKVLSLGVFWLELLGPLFLFIPLFSGFFRTSVVFAFFALHVGIALHMRLGIFPWVCVAAVSGLLPGWFWNHLFSFFPILKKIQVPAGWVSRLSFLVQQSGSKRRNPFFFKFKRLLYPFSQGIAFCAILFVVFWNLCGLRFLNFSVPKKMHWFGTGFRLGQKWSLFAPYPLKDDGWPVIVGKLEDGGPVKEIDLWRNGKVVDWEKPENLTRLFGSSRWRKYFRRVWTEHVPLLRPHLAKYYCHWWKHQKGRLGYSQSRLESVIVYYMQERTRADFSEAPAKREKLWEYSCLAT